MENKEKKGIVLNRMYTGSYLSNYLGHEVINMFQADNGKHYLYLLSNGNFNSRGKNMGTMLLVRGIGNNKVEIVGKAENLIPVESACCRLPRNFRIPEPNVQKSQQCFMCDEDIEYGGVSIQKLFEGEGQQSVFVSYYTEKGNFFKPKEPIIIKFPKKSKDSNGETSDLNIATSVEYTQKEGRDVKLSINFASQSLHQFVEHSSSPQDWEELKKICEDSNNWIEDNTKVVVPEDFVERQDTLFDICQILDDENRFSNALSYFINKYPDLWHQFFSEKLNIDLGKIDSVTREENAKIDSGVFASKTGGRIDLLIRTANCYIIVENKIDSSVIDIDGLSQLERYYNYVNCQRRDKENANKHIEGFVLTPEYNKPDDQILKVKDTGFAYKPMTYKDMYDWLTKNAMTILAEDINFKAFYDAMEKHTYKHKNLALYEEMKNRLFSRIKKCHKENKDA